MKKKWNTCETNGTECTYATNPCLFSTRIQALYLLNNSMILATSEIGWKYTPPGGILPPVHSILGEHIAGYVFWLSSGSNSCYDNLNGHLFFDGAINTVSATGNVSPSVRGASRLILLWWGESGSGRIWSRPARHLIVCHSIIGPSSQISEWLPNITVNAHVCK